MDNNTYFRIQGESFCDYWC